MDADGAALVLKLGSYPQHHGGLAVIRTLGRLGAHVYGVHEHRATPAARSAYLTGGFVWTTGSPAGRERDLLAGLAAIADRIGRDCVVVTTDDHAAVFLNEHSALLPRTLLQPSLAPGLARQLFDKARCRELATALGHPVPAATVARCPTDRAALGEVRLPVIVKRAERGLLADGDRTYSTMIVRDEGALRSLVEAPGEPHNILIQELVPGQPGDDWLFHGYCDANGDCIVGFTGRKLRSYPAYHGETAFAEAVDNSELRHQMTRLLKAIGFAGICSMDLRFDRRDGTYRLLDLNPRTGACFRMFENVHGVDVVRAMYLDLLGREVPRGAQRGRRTYVVEPYDVRAGGRYGLTVAQRLHALVSADEHAWLASDDLIPAGVLALRQSVARRQVGDTTTTPQYFVGRAGATQS